MVMLRCIISFRRSFLKSAIRNCRRNASSASNVPQFMEFHKDWPERDYSDFLRHMTIIPDFLSREEVSKFLEEIEPYLQRMRYEFDHWDDAIHGFRETERQHWYPYNKATIERIRNLAFKDEALPHVHILDLAEEGVIKPHVDSVRYCGSTIAGVSLLSDSVMRLVRIDEKKYQQNAESDYRKQPDKSAENSTDPGYFVNILLPKRSLYIMRKSARYNFTHEILGNKDSFFEGKAVKKYRRISIVCRNKPESQ
ncbi:alpha-ketoglutarate-dependent dioxygenase alkB homolog 7, mitochondrial [Phlebotomus argentipes]|uniref:alpha-ketoglutarate-dependent dioxygenase alkB homolog 7, mitochondrial n=1 Tax=Phlebotomus argentipes TaxID=94469 RepID=UPI002892BFD8|nr:alpha-ketoglutarate-dependent dioxygenase alkB homolog 7, mitochondrial [Phlebotomus argentipes]